jgi:hypothetical protein
MMSSSLVQVFMGSQPPIIFAKAEQQTLQFSTGLT